jgi:hypothetical protein
MIWKLLRQKFRRHDALCDYQKENSFVPKEINRASIKFELDHKRGV